MVSILVPVGRHGECAYILQTLTSHQWRNRETAAALGIDRTYL